MAEENQKKITFKKLSELTGEYIGPETVELDLRNKPLSELPDEITQLTELKYLHISYTRLTTLPDSIGDLKNLEILDLPNNQFTEVPPAIINLTKLWGLSLERNRLRELPEFIGQLPNLRYLYLQGNKLTSVPTSLAQLEQLRTLKLDDNPLNPALKSAYDAGIDELRAYLRSLAEPARREELYEAKLVLVGEGDVGKTTLLNALTGREPKANEPTTHGVSIDIQALHLPHRKKEGTKIQLNAWDFGGQEVYRATHQFFFSGRSVYLLVWEPRRGVLQCQVEDWLKLLRLRVGPDARVIIVSTYSRSGGHIARIDKEVFIRNFGSMIVAFHEVDSLVDDPATGEKVGIAELKQLITDAAQDLPQMGMEFNRDWREARDELLAIEEPRISYRRFADVCRNHGLDDIAARTLASLMHDLGYIFYYGDDERLRDEVVLKPEWLTKAIGFVLEDRKTQEMDGILPDSRLKDVWAEHPFKNQPRYEDTTLYPFFLRLMEKFDVSYRLEDGTASLVAQHVPQVRPALPWLPEEKPAPERRRIAMVCVMDEAPTGLVPWMIVRTHPYAHEQRGRDGQMHRLHWQKGMFLRNKSHGEALVELRDREFHIYAEAVWPEYFMNVLRSTLHKLITDNWPGLEGRYSFAVPCAEIVNGKACEGHFYIEALRQFLEEGDVTIRCQMCFKRQDIVELLYGFEKEDSREQLGRIEDKLDSGFADTMLIVKELESRVANYVMVIMQAIATESKEGPRLFTIEPADGNWRRPFSERHRLQLWCEAEGCQHPVFENERGVYEFEASREWVKRIAPYANFVAGVLKTLLPMVAPAVGVAFGPEELKQQGLKEHLDLVKEGTGKLMKEVKISDHSLAQRGELSEAERSGVLALHTLIRDIDPRHERLGLKRIPTYTGNYLWLCQMHYEQAQPKIPDVIE